MTEYLIEGKAVRTDDPSLAALLAKAYAAKARPRCLCVQSGIEMYIANVQGRYIVKRMPDTGGEHTTQCDAYEPPPELSGLGQVIGSAIQEDPEDGSTALKLAFSLSKGASRAAPAPSEIESSSVKADAQKLTLRATLHFLWEQAGFNRWSPAMANKRSWWVVRKHLLQAAQGMTAKRTQLEALLFIPEAFNAEKKQEIAQRRTAQLQKALDPERGARPLMLVICDVKEIAASRYGHKVIARHLPDFPLMLSDDIHKRLVKRFALELSLWDALPGTHLMMVGTFSLSRAGIASMEEIALMCVTEDWLPFESTFEREMLEVLTREQRRFQKGLRYNMPSSLPLASAVLSDTGAKPAALYIVEPSATEDFEASLGTLIGASHWASWVWRPAQDAMPPLPPRPGLGDLTAADVPAIEEKGESK